MLLVQNFLKSNSLTDLERLHAVKARLSGYKFSLNYDQLECRDDDPLAQQCRGLILRTASTKNADLHAPMETVALARPFDRFFNYGQHCAADVCIDDAYFYEKLDGTLIIVYYDDVKRDWCIATRSVVEADQPIDGYADFTFASLFEKALLDQYGFVFASWAKAQLDVTRTYMFELTTPVNRIVVDYPNYSTWLLGSRSTQSGIEYLPLEDSAKYGVQSAPMFRFDDMSGLLDFVAKRDPTAHEGIVVCDSKFRRVKVKNAGYIAMNKLRDSVANSPRALLEIILLDKLDDAVPLLPDYLVEKAYGYRRSLAEYLRAYDSHYVNLLAYADTISPDGKGSTSHRKAYAVEAQAHGLSLAPLMMLYAGRVSGMRDWVEYHKQSDASWTKGFLDFLLSEFAKVPSA